MRIVKEALGGEGAALAPGLYLIIGTLLMLLPIFANIVTLL